MPSAANGVVPAVGASFEPKPIRDRLGFEEDGPQTCVVEVNRVFHMIVPWAKTLAAVVSAKAASISFFKGVCVMLLRCGF